MAKLKSDPIKQSDLIDYLKDHSDFSFELEILNALVELGFQCEHGGTYEDPATQKPRQYDIRATRQMEDRFLRFAVECKNLRPNFPLLISCVPRQHEEAFHEVSISGQPQTEIRTSDGRKANLTVTTDLAFYSQGHRLRGTDSLYAVDAPVGKSCDQVGRSQSDGNIISGDSDIYDKWAQALSSAHDLISLVFSDGKHIDKYAYSLVFPLVVVPNNRLWCVRYDADGNRISEPELLDRCSFFVNRKYSYRSFQTPPGGRTFVVSHLEFVTLNGLRDFANLLCNQNAVKLYSIKG
jgi:hypothetical protein